MVRTFHISQNSFISHAALVLYSSATNILILGAKHTCLLPSQGQKGVSLHPWMVGNKLGCPRGDGLVGRRVGIKGVRGDGSGGSTWQIWEGW